MTARTRTDLKNSFENNDIPQGSDYSDLIDSFVNLLDTGLQIVSGNFVCQSVGAASVSAANMTATTFAASSVNTTSLVISGKVNIPVVSVSAVGTAQASALPLGYNGVTRVVFVDGANDAVILPTPNAGTVQYVVNDTTSALAVYPFTSCRFVSTAQNAKQILQSGKSATILHITGESYAIIVGT